METKNSIVDSFFGSNQRNDSKENNINNVESNKSGVKDDLTKINGIGPVVVATLKNNGVTTFSQLANIDVDELQNFIKDIKGKHSPISWIEQAKIISEETTKNKSTIAILNSEEKKSAKKMSKISKKINILTDSKNKRKQNKDKVSSIKTIVGKTNAESMLDIKFGKNFLLRIVNFVLLVLFFSSSLFFTNQTFQGIDFEKSTFFYLSIAVITGLMIIQFLLQRSVKIRKTFLDRFLFIFVLVYGISVIYSVDRWHSIVGFFGDPSRGFIFVIVMVVTFYLILSNFTIQTAKRALKLIVISIVLLNVYTLISGLGLVPSNIQIFIPFSLVGSLRSLTMVLSVGIPLLVVSYLSIKNNKHKIRALFLQGIILACLIITLLNLIMLSAFVSWTALAGGLIVFIFLLINKDGKNIGNIFGRKVIFTVLILFILLAGWAKSDYYKLMPTFIKIGLPTEVQAGLPVSYEIVKNSLQSSWKQALIGSGPTTFGYDFARFSPKGLISPVSTVEYLYQGNGILAEIIPTVGLIAAICIIIWGIIFIINSFRALNIENNTRPQLVGLLVASIILFMNILGSRINGGLMLFSVLLLSLAMFFILNSLNDKKYYTFDLKELRFSKFVVALIMLMMFVGLLGGGIFVTKAYLADVYFAQTLSEKDLETAKDKIVQSIQIRPEEGVYYTKLGQIFLIMLDKEMQLKEEKDLQKIKTLKNNTVGYVEKGAALMINDVKTQRFLATVYERTGIENISKLRKTYEHIIELDPNNIQYYIKIGDLYLMAFKKGDDDNITQALKWYNRALEVQPGVSILYDRIAAVFYQKKDLDKAISNMIMAIKMKPNNVGYKFTLGTLYQLKGGEENIAVAEKIFKALLKNNPKNIDVLTQLGLLYEQIGDVEEAKKQYQQIINVVGDDEKFEKIREIFNKFISNLDEGKLNIKKEINKNTEESVSADKKGGENGDKIKKAKEQNDKKNDKENISEDVNEDQGDGEKITVTIGEEGPVNVRDEGSLSGKKITKIMTTGQFTKIGENGKWVQIVIPAHDGQQEIRGWVYDKFVNN